MCGESLWGFPPALTLMVSRSCEHCTGQRTPQPSGGAWHPAPSLVVAGEGPAGRLAAGSHHDQGSARVPPIQRGPRVLLLHHTVQITHATQYGSTSVASNRHRKYQPTAVRYAFVSLKAPRATGGNAAATGTVHAQTLEGVCNAAGVCSQRQQYGPQQADRQHLGVSAGHAGAGPGRGRTADQ